MSASAEGSKGFRRRITTIGSYGAERTKRPCRVHHLRLFCLRAATAQRPQSDRQRNHLPLPLLLLLILKKKYRSVFSRARVRRPRSGMLPVCPARRRLPLASLLWPFRSFSTPTLSGTGAVGWRHRRSGGHLRPPVRFRVYRVSWTHSASGKTPRHGNGRVAGMSPRRRISSSGNTGCENLPNPLSRAETAIRRGPGRLP